MADPTAPVTPQPYRTYNYGPNSELIEIIDDTGIATNRFSWDDNIDPLLTGRTDPDGDTLTYAYDSSGRLVHVQDPGAHNTITLAYDSSDRLVSIQDTRSPCKTITYDDDSRGTDGP